MMWFCTQQVCSKELLNERMRYQIDGVKSCFLKDMWTQSHFQVSLPHCTPLWASPPPMASSDVSVNTKGRLKPCWGRRVEKAKEEQKTGNSKIGKERTQLPKEGSRGEFYQQLSQVHSRPDACLNSCESPIPYKLETARRARCSHTTWQTLLACLNTGRIENGWVVRGAGQCWGLWQLLILPNVLK